MTTRLALRIRWAACALPITALAFLGAWIWGAQ